MEATKHSVVLLVLLLLISVPAQSAGNPPAAQISNTHTASCLVKITFDPLVLPLDDMTIDYLLHSSSIGGKVAREVLNISPDQVSDIFKVEALAGSAGPSWLGRAETGSILTEDRRQKTEGRGQRTELLSSEQMSSAEQTILFRLSVELGNLSDELGNDVKPAAEEFMVALSLDKQDDSQTTRLSLLYKNLQAAP